MHRHTHVPYEPNDRQLRKSQQNPQRFRRRISKPRSVSPPTPPVPFQIKLQNGKSSLLCTSFLLRIPKSAITSLREREKRGSERAAPVAAAGEGAEEVLGRDAVQVAALVEHLLVGGDVALGAFAEALDDYAGDDDDEGDG